MLPRRSEGAMPPPRLPPRHATADIDYYRAELWRIEVTPNIHYFIMLRHASLRHYGFHFRRHAHAFIVYDYWADMPYTWYAAILFIRQNTSDDYLYWEYYCRALFIYYYIMMSWIFSYYMPFSADDAFIIAIINMSLWFSSLHAVGVETLLFFAGLILLFARHCHAEYSHRIERCLRHYTSWL